MGAEGYGGGWGEADFLGTKVYLNLNVCLAFTCMQGECLRRRLRSLLVLFVLFFLVFFFFRELLTLFVSDLCTNALVLVLF